MADDPTERKAMELKDVVGSKRLVVPSNGKAFLCSDRLTVLPLPLPVLFQRQKIGADLS